jgi:hypothetical protein
MGLITQDQSSDVDMGASYILTSAIDWRTDRVNVMAYGPPGCGKTDFGARFPYPIIIDTGENGSLTVKKMLAEGRLERNIPVLQTTDFSLIMEIAAGGPLRLAEIFRGDTKWDGYEKTMQSIVFDTFTTLEGFCWTDILQKHNKGESSAGIPENNALRRRMTAFFRAAWNLPYNTVLLGHDDPGRLANAAMTKKDPGPMLTGRLTKQAPALTDFFIFQRKECSSTMGEADEYVSYTDTHINIGDYPARNKLRCATGPLAESIQKLLPTRIVDLDYSHLRKALDKLEELLEKREEKE